MNEITVNEIKNYQQILARALEILPNQEDAVLFEQSLHIISIISQYQIVELADEVFKIMEIKDLRSLAIETLGFWLHLPWFKEQAYEIFVNDPDLEVKFSALLSWTSYYTGSKDPIVLEKLYMILINDNNPIPIRKVALTGILNVSDFNYKKSDPVMANLMNITSKKPFHEQIDWSIIIKIMKTYVPKTLKIYPIKIFN